MDQCNKGVYGCTVVHVLSEAGMDRSKVYEIIDGEREYQNSLWKDLDDKNSLGDFITYMENYLTIAKKELYGTYENNKSRNAVRKVVGIGVAALEKFGCESRAEEGSLRK